MTHSSSTFNVHVAKEQYSTYAAQCLILRAQVAHYQQNLPFMLLQFQCIIETEVQSLSQLTTQINYGLLTEIVMVVPSVVVPTLKQ